MKANRLSRRRFLVGAGGAALALPLLPSLLPRAAAVSDNPRRFLGVMSINGQFAANWVPDTTGATAVAEHVHVKALSEIGGDVSAVVGAPFDPIRNKLSILLGLDGLTEFGHNRCFPLTASTHSLGGTDRDSAPFFPYSVDAVLEHSSAFYTETPAAGALRLAPMPPRRRPSASSGAQSFSWWTEGGVTTRIPYQFDARVVFDSLFGGAPSDPTAVDPRERQMLVIDRVKEDYDRLTGHTRLGAEDRQRLSNYVDHLRDLETRIATAAAISCDGPTVAETDDLDVIYSNHIDLIVAAFACGITRIGTLMIRHGGSSGADDGFHGNSHKNGPDAERVSLGHNDWVGRKVAELLTKLDAIDEADGSTILDNSAVLWSNEIAMGSSHNQLNMPVLVAGGAGGRLRTGEVVDFRQDVATWTRGGPLLGRPYNQLLTSLMSAMGLGPGDWELGDGAGFGDYSKIGATFAREGGWDRFIGRENELLPHYVVG